jgi:hypothetical protein
VEESLNVNAMKRGEKNPFLEKPISYFKGNTTLARKEKRPSWQLRIEEKKLQTFYLSQVIYMMNQG